MAMKGIVASTAGLAILLNEGIGDTIRVSLTPEPGGDRAEEVRVAQQVLQSLGLRSFLPQVSACPGCGRTTSTFFQEMAQQIQVYLRDQMPIWAASLPRRGGDARRGHGLRRQRPGRVQARRHRHLPARHVRGAGRAGLRRRRAAHHAARRGPGQGVHRHPRRLRGPALRAGAPPPARPGQATADPGPSSLRPHVCAQRQQRRRTSRPSVDPCIARKKRRTSGGSAAILCAACNTGRTSPYFSVAVCAGCKDRPPGGPRQSHARRPGPSARQASESRMLASSAGRVMKGE